jgi:hypothetical protein
MVECKVFHHSSIVKVHRKGITYKDENNELLEIDFYECRRNWIKYVNTSEEVVADDLSEDSTNCVAWRDIFASPGYIEFFELPRIRFQFNDRRNIYEWLLKKQSSKGRNHFIKLQIEIQELGWTTYDLG